MDQVFSPSATRLFWTRLILHTPPSPTQRVQEDQARTLGFVHLFSASGIHLWALFHAVRAAVLLGLQWVGRLPHPIWLRLADGVSLSFTAGAWILAGAPWGMLRPAFIVGFRTLIRGAGLRARIFAPLLLALLVEYSLSLAQTGWKAQALESGRWHYALSVAFGLWAAEIARTQGYRGFKLHAAMAVGSWIPIAWLEIFSQGWTALYTPVLSLITVPVIAQLGYPILCTLLILPFSNLQAGGNLLLTGLHQIYVFFEQICLRGAPVWFYLSNSAVIFFFVSVALFWITRISSPSVRRALWILGGLWLCYRTTFSISPLPVQTLAPNSVVHQIQQLAVGQGDAALVSAKTNPENHSRHFLIDTGPPHGLLLSQFWHAWQLARLPTGRSDRLGALDFVALTHSDQDHVGGAEDLARWVEWDKLITPLSSTSELHALPGAWAQRHARGPNGLMLGTLQKTHFARSTPLASQQPPPHPSECGLYLNLGDAPKQGEMALWASLKSGFQLEGCLKRVLKLSHHGSRTSSAPHLIQEYSPTHAWISAGKHNRYGHPSTQVIDFINDNRITLATTQEAARLAIHD